MHAVYFKLILSCTVYDPNDHVLFAWNRAEAALFDGLLRPVQY
jgi:hypothetical protein